MTSRIYSPVVTGNSLAIQMMGTDLAGIGAALTIENTSKLVTAGGETFFQFQTDRDGLERAFYCARDAVDGINRGLATVGRLLVHVDKREMDAGDIAAVGLLVAGLAELSAELFAAQTEMHRGLMNGHHLPARENLGTVASGGDHE